MKIYIILFVLIILIISGIYMFNYYKKGESGANKIISFKDETFAELARTSINSHEILLVRITSIEILNKGSRSERFLANIQILKGITNASFIEEENASISEYMQEKTALEIGKTYLVALVRGTWLPAYTLVEAIPIAESQFDSVILQVRDRLSAEILKTSQMLETRDFSCPGMNGFTFKYPVFALMDYEYESNFAFATKTGEDECTILFNTIPKGAFPTDALQVRISKEGEGRNRAITNGNWETNPNNVQYARNNINEQDSYVFAISDFRIVISLINVKNDSGFSQGIFWKTVIDSFRATE